MLYCVCMSVLSVCFLASGFCAHGLLAGRGPQPYDCDTAVLLRNHEYPDLVVSLCHLEVKVDTLKENLPPPTVRDHTPRRLRSLGPIVLSNTYPDMWLLLGRKLLSHCPIFSSAPLMYEYPSEPQSSGKLSE